MSTKSKSSTLAVFVLILVVTSLAGGLIIQIPSVNANPLPFGYPLPTIISIQLGLLILFIIGALESVALCYILRSKILRYLPVFLTFLLLNTISIAATVLIALRLYPMLWIGGNLVAEIFPITFESLVLYFLLNRYRVWGLVSKIDNKLLLRSVLIVNLFSYVLGLVIGLYW